MKTKYKSAIVTGASSGIGAAIAKKLAMNNCHVVAVSRNLKNLEAQRESLPKKSRNFFHCFKMDITKFASHPKLFEVAEQYGPVDLFVNNAGVGVSKPLLDMTENELKNVIETNLGATITLTRRILLRQQSHRNKLQIVIVSSMAGKMGFPMLSTYSATKHALEGFVDALRYELSAGVSLCVLRPGVTDTGFFETAGMNDFRKSVEGKKVLHTADSVAEVLFHKLDPRQTDITVGSDKFALPFLDHVPWRYKLKILNVTNKL